MVRTYTTIKSSFKKQEILAHVATWIQVRTSYRMKEASLSPHYVVYSKEPGTKTEHRRGLKGLGGLDV